MKDGTGSPSATRKRIVCVSIISTSIPGCSIQDFSVDRSIMGPHVFTFSR